MELTRRDFLGLGKGAAASAVLAGLGLAGMPKEAQAIIGIDDALLGAVVVAVATLGGFALYNQFSGNLGLQAVGKSFGDYVSAGPNRVAAAASAAEIAATYGLSTTQERFELAAESIANGAGAFAEIMAASEQSQRLALDTLVSGSGELVGAFRELVSGWLQSGALGATPSTVAGLTTIGTTGVGTLPYSVGITSLQSMCSAVNAPSLPVGATSGFLRLWRDWAQTGSSTHIGGLYVGTEPFITGVQWVSGSSVNFMFTGIGTYWSDLRHYTNPSRIEAPSFERYSYNETTFSQYNIYDHYMTPDLVGAIQLPAVDVPADVPDVIGAGWDSLPIASDMVISPTTGDIVSAGSIPLPVGIPTTAGDYAAALQGALAGVIADTISLPVSIATPVTVATPIGVETMPISEAISTETSLQLDYAPDIPITPVLPPVEVPEGPWTPAVELPFMNVWPFNMIYTFIDTMSRLGGN